MTKNSQGCQKDKGYREGEMPIAILSRGALQDGKKYARYFVSPGNYCLRF